MSRYTESIVIEAEQRRQQIAIAAKAATDDYSTNGELTAFAALDGEDVYDSPGGELKLVNFDASKRN